MRAFIALSLPDELRLHAVQIAEAVTADTGARLVPAVNLHVTVQFLGDLSQQIVEQVAAALIEGGGGPVVRVRTGQVVARPSWQRARLVALELHDLDGALSSLARRVEDLTGAMIGGAVSNRPLWPHITLARFIRPERVRRSPTSQSERVFDITRLALYHSHIAPGHTPRYDELLGITLGTHAQRSPSNG